MSTLVLALIYNALFLVLLSLCSVFLRRHSNLCTQVVGTHDASNPIKENLGTPILTCDVSVCAFVCDSSYFCLIFRQGC